jgi:hypothetical protein
VDSTPRSTTSRPAKLPSPPPSLLTALVLFAMCKALALEMRIRRRVRALAGMSCGALPNGRPELGLVLSNLGWFQAVSRISLECDLTAHDQTVSSMSDLVDDVRFAYSLTCSNFLSPTKSGAT